MFPPLRFPTFLLALTCLLLTASAHGAAPASLDPILRGLANTDFAAREAAQRELERLPASNMQLLQKTADAQADPEVKARLQVRIEQMTVENLWTLAAAPPPRFDQHLTGRLLDAAGKPIPNVQVTARSAALGGALWGSYELSARTDPAGRFDVAVPFGEILYYISTEHDAYTNAL